MEKCNTCYHFNPNEKHSDREGYCDVKREFMLPNGSCRQYLRIDEYQPELEFNLPKEEHDEQQ